KPYYLEPEKGAEKAYLILREALNKSKKVGIANFVLRNKEHLAVIKPFGKAIVLNQLRFNEEIRPPDGLNLPEAKSATKGKEVEIALALIDHLTDHFKPQAYKDTYQKELRKVIEAKAKGKTIKIKKEEEPEPTEVADIMKLLKASLEKERVKA
ncbi:MAG TPA: Ku protein, partial [Verrucomicrobiae bacterium]|nr:Ku protein [Verrucomicrobiae bacterium]